MAPSSLSDSGLRSLARTRGYRVRKLRYKDRYYLLNPGTGSVVVANEHCEDPDDCYFTKYQLVEFLRDEPIIKQGNA